MKQIPKLTGRIININRIEYTSVEPFFYIIDECRAHQYLFIILLKNLCQNSYYYTNEMNSKNETSEDI